MVASQPERNQKPISHLDSVSNVGFETARRQQMLPSVANSDKNVLNGRPAVRKNLEILVEGQ